MTSSESLDSDGRIDHAMVIVERLPVQNDANPQLQADLTRISQNAHLQVKTPARAQRDADIRRFAGRLMHRHVRTGGATRMNAGLVCGQQAQGRLRGEAR